MDEQSVAVWGERAVCANQGGSRGAFHEGSPFAINGCAEEIVASGIPDVEAE